MKNKNLLPSPIYMSVNKNKTTKKVMAPEPNPKLIKRFKETNRPITSAQYPPFIKTKPIQIEGMAKGFMINSIAFRELVEPQYNKSLRYKLEYHELLIKTPNKLPYGKKWRGYIRAIALNGIDERPSFGTSYYHPNWFSFDFSKKKGELISEQEIINSLNEMIEVFANLKMINKIPSKKQIREVAKTVHQQLEQQLKALGDPAY